jgi:DNA-binding response OmpR family regulator
LVVEDDPDLQWRLARMLTIRGSRVVGTSTGNGALALISQWPVDLVLVDDGLPEMSGLEVIRSIHEKDPSVPLVLMAAEVTPELRIAARAAGASTCVEKPFTSEQLSDLLAMLAEQDRLAEPAE